MLSILLTGEITPRRLWKLIMNAGPYLLVLIAFGYYAVDRWKQRGKKGEAKEK